MQAPAPPKPPFPVMDSFMHGVRFFGRHFRLIAVLSFLPLTITFVTMLLLRLPDTPLPLFWLPITQLPASFVLGLQCALILRFIVLHEYPIIEDDTQRRERNTAVTQAAIMYAAVTYFITGAYALLLKLRAFLLENPEAAAPYSPLALAVMVLMLWATRWFWLHVPVALDWPVKAFYERVGGWGGTLRIFGLFAICSVFIQLVASFLRELIIAAGGKNPTGIFAALEDGVIAAGTLVLAVLFTCATAAAVKLMAGTKPKDLES